MDSVQPSQSSSFLERTSVTVGLHPSSVSNLPSLTCPMEKAGNPPALGPLQPSDSSQLDRGTPGSKTFSSGSVSISRPRPTVKSSRTVDHPAILPLNPVATIPSSPPEPPQQHLNSQSLNNAQLSPNSLPNPISFPSPPAQPSRISQPSPNPHPSLIPKSNPNPNPTTQPSQSSEPNVTNPSSRDFKLPLKKPASEDDGFR